MKGGSFLSNQVKKIIIIVKLIYIEESEVNTHDKTLTFLFSVFGSGCMFNKRESFGYRESLRFMFLESVTQNLYPCSVALPKSVQKQIYLQNFDSFFGVIFFFTKLLNVFMFS